MKRVGLTGIVTQSSQPYKGISGTVREKWAQTGHPEGTIANIVEYDNDTAVGVKSLADLMSLISLKIHQQKSTKRGQTKWSHFIGALRKPK